ncbi:DUF6362 family protein [Thalassospira alkalitolerans]|uniref:DUF6362 family protein n=1 Tax=Thalassospira alkalitolerans TaxID=1293890 RepID=UPI0030EEE49D|tara:strand:+ start:19461 stop:19904 length:444 start_codon:yes stop_codon:yes gene_type:complete
MGEMNWTPLMVEERIVEAADVLRRLPEERVRGYFGVWPEVVHDFADKVGQEPQPMRRPPPSAGAISRMDETLPWLGWIDPLDAKIIWLRASGKPWKTVCWTVGMARTAAHRHWLYGLCVLAWKLNGRRIPRNRSRLDVIAMVQSAKA